MLIAAMILAWILPPILSDRAEKQILGTWCLDTFDGNGKQYATFDESGTVQVYAQIVMTDDSVISQDYSGLGSMTYHILDSDTMQLSTTVMGVTTTEEVSYRLKGKDTLILNGSVYTRYVDVLSDKS